MGIDKDRVEGSWEQAKGKAKEVAGKVTGDAKTEAEGEEILAVGCFVSVNIDRFESARLIGELAARAGLNLARDRTENGKLLCERAATRTWV